MKLTLWHWLVIAVVAIVIFKPDLLSSLGGTAAPDVIVNPTPTTKTVTVVLKDRYNIGTDVPQTNNTKVFKNGVLQSDIADGGTISADAGDVLLLYGGENSTAYYTDKKSYTVLDTLNQPVQIDLCVIDTGFTTYWVNEQGTASTNVTVGSGATKSFKVHADASSYKCFGNPHADFANSAAGVIRYNISVWSAIDVLGTTPCAESYTGVVSSSTGYGFQCFEFPGMKNGEGKDFTFTVSAISGVDPATSTSALLITWIDKDFDFNAITGAEIKGFQDESNTNLGDTSTQTCTIGIL